MLAESVESRARELGLRRLMNGILVKHGMPNRGNEFAAARGWENRGVMRVSSLELPMPTVRVNALQADARAARGTAYRIETAVNSAPEVWEVVAIDTANDRGNAPMLAVNDALGFR